MAKLKFDHEKTSIVDRTVFILLLLFIAFFFSIPVYVAVYHSYFIPARFGTILLSFIVVMDIVVDLWNWLSPYSGISRWEGD